MLKKWSFSKTSAISKTEVTIFFVFFFASFYSVYIIEQENPKSGDWYFRPILKSFQAQGVEEVWNKFTTINSGHKILCIPQ